MTTTQPPRASLTLDERRQLLFVARAAVAAAVAGAGAAPLPPFDDSGSDRFTQPAGAFVTLRAAGTLRGCIGHVEPDAALVDTVRRVAALAATEDPRFASLTAAELTSIEIEVSVLGPLVECDDPDRLVVGRHGVAVDDGVRRGLLLPQVAGEWGWDARRLLAETCRKAGLAPDAWRRGARVCLFEAEVFGDGDAEHGP